MAKRRMKLSTPEEVRKSLARVANMIINDELDTKKASTFTYVCNGILQSIRADDQEKRLEELEQYVNVLKDQDKQHKK
ncbi:hypothetical protein ACYUJ6_02120 [Clostridium sp. JNZ X4-2]